MNQEEFLEQMEENYNEALEITKKKNSDYADENDPFQNFRTVEELGIISTEESMLSQIAIKLQRITNLMKRDPKVTDESKEDTLMDMMNYTNILLTYLQSETKKCDEILEEFYKYVELAEEDYDEGTSNEEGHNCWDNEEIIDYGHCTCKVCGKVLYTYYQ